MNHISLVLRSAVFLLCFSITTAVYSLLLVVMRPIGSQLALARVARSWGRVSLWWLRFICQLEYTVQGVEHLSIQPAVVLANHQSAWETIALRALLPLTHTWVLKHELLWVPFFGWALAVLKPISIRRRLARQALKQVLLHGELALRAGLSVMIFPEGTRMAPTALGDFTIGGAKLAERAQVPVIPVAHNAGLFWGRRSFLKLPGVIHMVVGAPIATTNKTAADINSITRHWIETTITQLPPPHHTIHYRH